jgi:hypothetical protein
MVASLERDNLVVFYYLSTPEIWHDERMAFGENALLEGAIVFALLFDF